MQTARLAIWAAMLSRSASETAATVSIPKLWQALMTRTAISPRFATNTRVTLMDTPDNTMRKTLETGNFSTKPKSSQSLITASR
jgi:hypothetical protein